MEIFKYIIFISFLLFSTESTALNLAGTEQPLEKGLYDNRSCNDLYIQASALEQDTFIFKANVFNDKRTSAATYAMTVFAPAAYYIVFNSYQNYKAQLRSEIAMGKIGNIRSRLAAKHCFEHK